MRKGILAKILLITLSLTFITGCSKKEVEKIGSIGIGDKYTQVSKISENNTITVGLEEKGIKTTTVGFDYMTGEHKYIVNFKEDEVVAVSTSKPDIKTTKGIGVSSSKKEVEKEYKGKIVKEEDIKNFDIYKLELLSDNRIVVEEGENILIFGIDNDDKVGEILLSNHEKFKEVVNIMNNLTEEENQQLMDQMFSQMNGNTLSEMKE